MSISIKHRNAAVILFVYLLLIITTNSICDKPINLNTASLSQLDSLPFITPKSAQLIIDIRPICSPLELTTAPKKIKGITVKRLKKNWNWFEGKRCSTTCCKGYAVCRKHDGTSVHISASPVAYHWKPGDWNKCTSKCGKGTQHRSATCHDPSDNIVDNKYCVTLEDKPLLKRICNTDPCPTYEWKPDKWGECISKSHNSNVCIQKRAVKCYDTANNVLSTDAKCNENKPDCKQRCACKLPHKHRSLLWAGHANVDGLAVHAHLLNGYNSKECNTDMYRNIHNADKTLITRRGCTVWIYVHITGIKSKIDVSWFYLDATLQAKINEIDNDVWNDNYLSWELNAQDDDVTDGWLGIALPNDGNIGEFLCNLYFSKTRGGAASSRKKVADFRLYILFNPYNSDDVVHMESVPDRNEYVENEFGLIWVGNADDNSAMKWKYDQFDFPNLEISMNLLHRLELKYRNNLVLISRQISYAVAEDVCYGKWGKGPYTSGPAPGGGYQCYPEQKNCLEPWAWKSTTQLFSLYRDVLKYKYKVQYCQCFIYAGVSTTVGRALGIPTRPTSNFQSGHDSDFNRAIESYWIFNEESRTYSKTQGESSDSVWNFHVWNEMFFKRTDFMVDAYNTAGWQAIDATPQEQSYGGNPALPPGSGAYQMGPAAISLIRENKNPHQCKDAASNKKRFGCFDAEFVISETNANYNFWRKSSREEKSAKFTLLKSFQVDPWDKKFGTIGVLTNTKKPDKSVSANCLNEAIRDCDNDYLDLTLFYKKHEPSDPGMPTDMTNYYKRGDKRYRRRRRLLWAGQNFSAPELEYEGIEYDIVTVPNKESWSPMIVADEANEIKTLYGDDFTFGMISLNIDSFEDNELDIYCSVTATAHDYSGEQLGEIIKINFLKFKLEPGESTDSCRLYLRFNDYSAWVHSRVRSLDDAEIAYIFRFTVSATIYDQQISDTKALDIIIEQRDILICSPEFKLRDRIICAHELDWFQPPSAAEVTFECYNNNNRGEIADGFCDDENNYKGCYDGGDCCPTTCVPTKDYKCQYFNCIDARVKIHNEHFENCPHISLFIEYINELSESGICNDVLVQFIEKKLDCPNMDTKTGDECIDHIAGIPELLSDDIESCYLEGIYSIQQSVIRPIVEFVVDCINKNDTQTKGTEVVVGAHNEYQNMFEYDMDDDKHFTFFEYEFILTWIVLVLLIGCVVWIACFIFGGLVGVFIWEKENNKNEIYSTSNDEQTVA